jgi:hypothetical protein
MNHVILVVLIPKVINYKKIETNIIIRTFLIIVIIKKIDYLIFYQTQ